MNPLSGTEESNNLQSHDKPCASCRKRKIKCDKTRPCSNCSRSKQLCTYESNDASNGGQSEYRTGDLDADGNVRERLARLEAFMASVLARGGGVEGGSHASSSSTPNQVRDFTPPLVNSGICGPVGQIVFQEGYSAYFDSDFWPGLINEV